MKTLAPQQALSFSGTIIDVVSDAGFAARHIPNAVNISIYETAFPDKIQERIPDKATPLLVYGQSDSTEEAQQAYDVLVQLGYLDVAVLAGGFASWKAAGGQVETGSSVAALHGSYTVSSESKLHWTGRNIGNKHWGAVQVKKGSVVFERGALTSATFTIDMTSISNADLSDAKYNAMLVHHLQSSDFFDVEHHPTATFTLRTCKPLNGPMSSPNWQVTGDLTIRGVTRSITFVANIHEKNGDAVCNAHFDLDRSAFGIKYGSEKFFALLGMHIISDIISFDLILVAKKGDDHS